MEKTILVMSYDAGVRDILRWAAGEFVGQIHVAMSWSSAIRLAGQHRPTVAILDFDNVSPQGRTYLAKVLPARHQLALIVVGGPESVSDAVRHGVTVGVVKPLDVGTLMAHVERALRSTG